MGKSKRLCVGTFLDGQRMRHLRLLGMLRSPSQGKGPALVHATERVHPRRGPAGEISWVFNVAATTAFAAEAAPTSSELSGALGRGLETKKAHLSVSLLSTAYGAGTRNRTRDLLITSQLLYHLSYTGNGASL